MQHHQERTLIQLDPAKFGQWLTNIIVKGDYNYATFSPEIIKNVANLIPKELET